MKKIYFLLALVLCAITANALDTKNSNVYFDGTDWNSYTVVQLMFGKSDGSAGCEMTKIENTNLYYLNTPEWNGYTQFCILGADAVWGWEGGSDYPLTTRKNWGLKSTAILDGYKLNTGESNLLTEGESTLNGTYLENGYESLNYVQSIVAGENGSVSASSFALNGANTTQTTTGNEIKAALTATVTCTATPNQGYLFDGWYDADENKVSEVATYTYTSYAANTLTAKFKVDPATAIESVAADANAPVEYYNLQGVKVANPENGIFIKKQGAKATKVIR